MQNKNNKQKGYTIIETMIAVSLFIVIMTAGMGTLLNANLLYNKSQKMRSIMDNLNFVMEDMSRNLRTGHDYVCLTTGQCYSIVFQDQDGSQWVYSIENNPNGNLAIFRSVGGATSVQLTPDEVNIDPASSFIVTGAPLGDQLQPFVTIKLVGKITYQNIDTSFSLQTSVSQRKLDI